jgi:Fur family iron response transcriptional regulator
MMKRLKEKYSEITQKLVAAGLRPTRQRILLGSLLFACEGCRHVTAEMLHRESKDNNINVSLATVYNTLHQFTDAGLLRVVAVDDGRSYFDTNVAPHYHFLNEDSQTLIDIPSSQINLSGIPSAPEGTMISSVDVVIKVKSARALQSVAH